MGAVDRADHYFASYGFTRKSHKWWRRLFFSLLEVSVVNLFILMNCNRRKEDLKLLTHVKFRRNLIEKLVGDVRNSSVRKRGRPSSTKDEERLNKEQHFMY
jgi:hypothetical protein